MKRSVLRILCACLLMGIAFAVTVGIYAALQKEEIVYVWHHVRLDKQAQVFRSDGQKVNNELLPTGEYYAVSDDVQTEFAITNDGIVVHSGGWTDGLTIYMTNDAIGSIGAEFLAEDRFYKFVLQKGDDTRCKIVRGFAGQAAKCEFLGLPFGNYDLYLDGKRIAAVQIDENTPMIIVMIP